MQSISFDEYQENKLIREAVECTRQASAEACLDIGHHIITVERFRSPADNSDVFAVLGEREVVPVDLVSGLVNTARLRDLLAHDYPRIDDAVV